MASVSSFRGIRPQVFTKVAPAGVATKSVTQATVDVAAVLDGLAKQKKQKLRRRTSIVDLMKLLDLDSSAPACKRFAEEIHYQGELGSSISAEGCAWRARPGLSARAKHDLK